MSGWHFVMNVRCVCYNLPERQDTLDFTYGQRIWILHGFDLQNSTLAWFLFWQGVLLWGWNDLPQRRHNYCYEGTDFVICEGHSASSFLVLFIVQSLYSVM